MNPSSAPAVSWRVLAVPSAHGGGGFLLEPMIVGLLVAPSAAGLALAAAALAAFLARHPLRLALADHLKGRKTPRTSPAWQMTTAYGALAALALGVAWTRSAAGDWLAALAGGAALLLAQLAYEVRSRGRELSPQLLGASAPGSLATAMALAAGAGWGVALALWALLALRGAASVLYVRARLRRDRGQPCDARTALAAHGIALLAVAGLAATGLSTWLPVAAFAALLVRASRGLRTTRRLRPQALGLSELGYGLGTATLIGLGVAWTP